MEWSLPILHIYEICFRGCVGSTSPATQGTPHVPLLENAESSQEALTADHAHTGLLCSVQCPTGIWRGTQRPPRITERGRRKMHRHLAGLTDRAILLIVRRSRLQPHACAGLGLASLLPRSAPPAGEGRQPPVLVSGPQIPIQTWLIVSVNKHQLAGFVIFGDRYFVDEKIFRCASIIVVVLSTGPMSGDSTRET